MLEVIQIEALFLGMRAVGGFKINNHTAFLHLNP